MSRPSNDEDEGMNARIPRCVAIAVALCVAERSLHETAAPRSPRPSEKNWRRSAPTSCDVHTPVRHDAIDEAEKKTSDAEQRLENFVKDSGDQRQRFHITSIRKLIDARRQAID